MSIKKPSRKGPGLMTITAALVFTGTALSQAPASLVVLFADFNGAQAGYSEARGTIWRGELSGAFVSGASLGDVSFRLSLLSVARLAPRIDLETRGGSVVGKGRVTFGPGGRVVLAGVDTDIDLAAAAPRGLLGEAAQGHAQIRAERIIFTRKKGCGEARGTIWTDALDAPAKRYNMPALPLSGAISCDAGVLVATLSGENARAGADMAVRIDRNLAYELSVTAHSREESLASALRVFGFEGDNGALTYGSAGIFKEAGS